MRVGVLWGSGDCVYAAARGDAGSRVIVYSLSLQGLFGVGQSTAKFINKETNIKTKFT